MTHVDLVRQGELEGGYDAHHGEGQGAPASTLFCATLSYRTDLTAILAASAEMRRQATAECRAIDVSRCPETALCTCSQPVDEPGANSKHCQSSER